MTCHEKKIFKNQNDAEEFKCPLKFGVLKNPIRDECGHLVCVDCFNEHYTANPTCPVTKQPISNTKTPADDIKQKIENLTIYCSHKEEDCAWQGTLGTAKDHLEKECMHEKVKCDVEKCDEQIKRIEMGAHKLKCEWVPKKCQFCTVVLNDIEMEEHHNSDCMEITIDCEKRCIMRYKRKNKALHDKFSCEKTKYDCYFRNAGCYFNGTWEEAGRHASEAFLLHASFLEQKLAHFEAYKKVTEELLNKVGENKDKYADLEPIIKKYDETEDGDYPMFQGNFDQAHSDKRLVFEDPRSVKSLAGNNKQMLFFDRKFHERHRIVISLEKYKPTGDDSCLAWGIATSGYYFENGMTEYNPALKRKHVMFSDDVKNPISQFKIKLKEGECYMMSYDPDEYMLYVEQLNSEVENPELVKQEFPIEFHEWQPVLVLSGEVSVKLMDFNDWNQY